MPQPLSPDEARVYRAYKALATDHLAMVDHYIPGTDELKPESAAALCRAITKQVNNQRELETPLVRPGAEAEAEAEADITRHPLAHIPDLAAIVPGRRGWVFA